MSAKNVSLNTNISAAQQAGFAESLQADAERMQETAQVLKASQEASKEGLEASEQPNTPAFANIRLQKAASKDTKSIERKARVQSSVFVRPEEADELGDLFSGQQKNKDYYLELQLLSKLVQELGRTINATTKPEEMIAIVQDRMTENNIPPQVAVVDKAFEFLLFVCTKKIENVEEEKLKSLEQGKAIDELDDTENRILAISQNIQVAKEKHLNSHRLEIAEEQLLITSIDFGSKINELTLPDEIPDMIRARLTVNNVPPDELTVHKALQFLIKKTTAELKLAIKDKNRNLKTRISKILTKIEMASTKHYEWNIKNIKNEQVILGTVDSVAESAGMNVEEGKRFLELVHHTPDIQVFRKECVNFNEQRKKLKLFREASGEKLKHENREAAEIPQIIKCIRLLQAYVGVHSMALKRLKTAESFLLRNRILT